jgi:hypothetical protein
MLLSLRQSQKTSQVYSLNVLLAIFQILFHSILLKFVKNLPSTFYNGVNNGRNKILFVMYGTLEMVMIKKMKAKKGR